MATCFPIPATPRVWCLVALTARGDFARRRSRLFPTFVAKSKTPKAWPTPPLLVVVHPSFHEAEESGSRSSRLRRVIAGALLFASAPLLWMGVRWPNDLTPYLPFTCILFGLRLLQWDFGLKHRETERRKRLEERLTKERGDA